MTLTNFFELLKVRIENSGLPGEAAQFKMAPGNRAAEPSDQSKVKNGGVLILLYPGKRSNCLLLTLRAEYPGVHSGQVSFPGGRMEENDKNLAETALRETEEETGVSKNAISLIGRLSSLYIPPSNFMVYPFIGYAIKKPDFAHDPKEVSSLIEVPIELLKSKSIWKRGKIQLANGDFLTCPYFTISDHIVWGATAMILSEFIDLICNPNPIKFDNYA